MTETQFRRLALSFKGAIERSHMNHPDFRAGERGKIFATIGPDGTWGMVKLTPEQQAHFVGAAPEAFKPAAGAWGRGGSTIVTFKPAKVAAVRIALEQAWRNVAPVPRAS
jgi:hypothetical protein